MAYHKIFLLTEPATIIKGGIYIFFDTIMDLTFTYIPTTKATSYQRAHESKFMDGVHIALLQFLVDIKTHILHH